MNAGLWRVEMAGGRPAVAAASVRGPRAENQDAVLVVRPADAADGNKGGTAWRLVGTGAVEEAVADWPTAALRLAVFDGMGGHQDGALAARLLAEALSATPFITDPAALRAAVLNVHADLRRRLPGPDERRGGATLAVVDLDLRSGYGLRAHVGDSRGYLLHRGRWRRLTHDHTADEFIWRDGVDEKTAADGGRLAQAVGFGSVGFRPGGFRSGCFGSDCFGSGGAEIFGAAGIDPALRLDLADDLADRAAHHADVARFRVASGDRILLATDGLLGKDDGAALLNGLVDAPPGDFDRIVAHMEADASDNSTGILFALDMAAAEPEIGEQTIGDRLRSLNEAVC